MNNREPDSEIEYQPKPWLSRLLLTAQTPETSNDALEDGRVTDLFLTRCEEAAYVGLSVLRLRRERHRVGFVPMSFDQYIDGLVKVADVSISPVLNWLGIKNLSSPVVSTAAVRLAREIDISRRELLAYVRIGFAAQFDCAPMALLMARRRSAGSRLSELDECENVLGQIEAEYDPLKLRELKEIESQVNTAYVSNEDETSWHNLRRSEK